MRDPACPDRPQAGIQQETSTAWTPCRAESLQQPVRRSSKIMRVFLWGWSRRVAGCVRPKGHAMLDGRGEPGASCGRSGPHPRPRAGAVVHERERYGPLLMRRPIRSARHGWAERSGSSLQTGDQQPSEQGLFDPCAAHCGRATLHARTERQDATERRSRLRATRSPTLRPQLAAVSCRLGRCPAACHPSVKAAGQPLWHARRRRRCARVRARWSRPDGADGPMPIGLQAPPVHHTGVVSLALPNVLEVPSRGGIAPGAM